MECIDSSPTTQAVRRRNEENKNTTMLGGCNDASTTTTTTTFSSIQSVVPSVPVVAVDDLALLPEELLCHCLKFLNVPSLVTMRAVSQRYLHIASSNDAGWDDLCKDLWASKIFVPKEAMSLLLGSNRSSSSSAMMMSAYRMSLQDAKVRQHLTLDELTFDEDTMEGTIWSFRFKESAGPDWTSWDPWHQGNHARQMVFLRNGTVKTYQTTDDQGNNEDDHDDHDGATATRARTVSSRHCGGGVALREPSFGASAGSTTNTRTTSTNTAGQPPQLVALPVEMRWRFISRPMDLPERPEGSYVRLTVSGRDVPTYVVRRSPTHNWGFLMESCWGIWTSFPMPLKKTQQQQEANYTNNGGNNLRLRRTRQGHARWVHLAAEEDDDDDDVVMEEQQQQDEDVVVDSESEDRHQQEPLLTTTTTTQEDRDSILADESCFIITNEVMWRESLLYNFGATVLPEEVDSNIDQMMSDLLGRAAPREQQQAMSDDDDDGEDGNGGDGEGDDYVVVLHRSSR